MVTIEILGLLSAVPLFGLAVYLVHSHRTAKAVEFVRGRLLRVRNGRRTNRSR